MEREKLFAAHKFYKRLLQETLKKSDNLIKNKTKQNKQITQFENLSTRSGGYFSRDSMQIGHRSMKRCPTSLITREMQIKTTRRHDYYHKDKRQPGLAEMQGKGC